MQNGGSATAPIDVPLIVFHGYRDNIVAPVNADRLIASRIAASAAKAATQAGEEQRRSLTETVPAIAIAAVCTQMRAAPWSASSGAFRADRTPGLAAARLGHTPTLRAPTRQPKYCGSSSNTPPPSRLKGRPGSNTCSSTANP